MLDGRKTTGLLPVSDFNKLCCYKNSCMQLLVNIYIHLFGDYN